MTVSPAAISSRPVTQTAREPNRAARAGVSLAVGIIAAASGSMHTAAISGLWPRTPCKY